MGVDYYPCDGCGGSYADCSEYIFGCDCGESYCSKECGDRQTDPENEDYYTCIMCRKEELRDYKLIAFLLSKLQLTRQAAVKLYYEEEDGKQGNVSD